MLTALDHHLARPLQSDASMPLRVSVYSRLREAIRDGLLPVSSLLPSESDLGAALGVSRTVVREALMLLEEDGYVHARRGIGRTVAEALPRHGLQRAQAPEHLFAALGGTVEVTRIGTAEQSPAPALQQEEFGLHPGESSWVAESLVTDQDGPVGLLQEHLPTAPRLGGVDGALPDTVQRALESSGSVLNHLLAELPARGTAIAASCEITAGVPGAARARALDIAADTPVLVLTQRLELRGVLFYLAKLIVHGDAGRFVIQQTV